MLFYFSIYLAYVPILISTIWGALNFGRLRFEFQILSIFIFISAATQVMCEFLALNKINNLPISHAYTIFGFWVLARFYQKVLTPFVPRQWFTILELGFTLFAIANAIFWQPLFTYNSIPITVEALVFIVLALSTFILSLNEEMNAHILPVRRSLNWLNSGIFIYFSGNTILFYNGEAIMHAISEQWTKYTWLVHSVLTFTFYSCLLMGLWTSPKK